MPARNRLRLAALAASLGCASFTAGWMGTGPSTATATAAVATGAVVVPFGDARAPAAADVAAVTSGRRVVAMAATPDGGGHWIPASDGGVLSFGSAGAHGSPHPQHLNQPIVGMAATPDGLGYWLVARDGGIFTYGSARFHGSAGGTRLNQPIVGMAATPDGLGYWLVARDGGIFTYGSARFHGSGTGSLGEGRAAASLARSPSGRGYAILAVPATVRVGVGGDVHGVDRVAAFMERGGDPLAHVRPLLTEHDATIVNLETAVGASGAPQRKQYTFQSPVALVQRLRAGGVTVVSLANNHSLDFGAGALLETIGHARDAGLLVVGAGANEAEAFAPAIVSTAAGSVAFVGLSQVVPPGWAATASGPGVASAYDLRASTAAVRSAGRLADHVVVLVHAGTEAAVCPTARQRSLSAALVEAGADVVAGAHPHVLQGIEQRDGAVVAYSLGNFVWYSGNPATGLLSVGLGPDGVGDHDLVPARVDGTGSPVPLSGQAADDVRAHVRSLTPGAGRC
jgi:hypothetical protein